MMNVCRVFKFICPIILVVQQYFVCEALQVIGAGLGRTGTDSLRKALNELGYGPTYHMVEILGIPGRAVGKAYSENHVDRWPLVVESILGKNYSTNDDQEAVLYEDWDNLFDGYRSAVDQPASLFAVELSKQYPNAKVVLTVRSSPSTWHKSITKAWCRFAQEGSMDDWLDQVFFAFRGSAYFALFSTFERRFRKLGQAMDEYVSHVLPGMMEDSFSTAKICRDKDYAIRYYNAWNQYIQDNIVPAERLLVLETGEKNMAKKLGDFLGVPRSKMETFTYPKSNTDEDFANGPIFFTRLEAALSVVGPFLLLLAIVSMIRWWKKTGGTPPEEETHSKQKTA